MSERSIPETDAAEAKRRAEWLHKHKAHKDWIILSVSEVAVIRDELLILERERDSARELAQAFHNDQLTLLLERDEAREELAEAKREAENLAKSIYRSEYSDNDTDWELLDSVAGVISQIDNMYAGVREQRDEAIQLLKLYVPIMRLQHIKKKLKNF